MSYIEKIAHSQNYFCFYCNHRMHRHIHVLGTPTPRDAITKDHFIPRVYGGVTTAQNIVAACCLCNNLRGEMEAVAFKNLIEKWFKRDPFLWIRWHTISGQELSRLKLNCITVHERQLRGKARRCVDIAYRHLEFCFQERNRLPQQA